MTCRGVPSYAAFGVQNGHGRILIEKEEVVMNALRRTECWMQFKDNLMKQWDSLWTMVVSPSKETAPNAPARARDDRPGKETHR